MSGRNSVLRGDIIELTAVFLDAAGNREDPKDLTFSIYPPGKNPEHEGVDTTDAWVYDVTLTSGGSGPQADPSCLVEKLSKGSYRYSFLVPEDADIGTAFDRWEAELDHQELDETFTFVIVGGGSVGTTKLYENNRVSISLDSSIASTDGDTLGEDIVYYFTTTYNPLYSSEIRIRLDMGPLVSDVPDDTINLAIFEASLYVDELSFNSNMGDASYLEHAKRQLTTCLAERTIAGALMGDSSISGRLSKTLGDLRVSRGGVSGGINKLFDRLDACMAKWIPVVESGGELGPHTSHKPTHSVKGATADDSIMVTRQWAPMSSLGGHVPSANTRRPDPLGSSRRGLRTRRKKY